MKALVKLAVALSVVIGSQVVKADMDIEKIIGKNELVAVDATASNMKAKYRRLVDAFGKIGMGCTATHIGNGYVLTAGHCFWAGETAIENQACAGAENEIQWGYREGVKPYLVSKCEKIIMAQRTDKMDYALLKVSPAPKAFIAADWSKRPKLNEKITIFSHPEELPLRWSGVCRTLRIQNDYFDDSLLHHECDTNPGSSGATILHDIYLKVVGIHDGGISDGNGGGLNYGTYIVDTPLKKILNSLKMSNQLP